MPAVPFKISFATNPDSGEHRAHINAPARDLAKLATALREVGTAATLAEQWGSTWAGRDVLSIPESQGAGLLRLLWRADNGGSQVAGQVFIALHHERIRHLAEHPDCPCRDDQWPG